MVWRGRMRSKQVNGWQSEELYVKSAAASEQERKSECI